MGLQAELHDFAFAVSQLAHADGHADAGRIAVDLGREIQLHDIALLNLAVSRPRNGVPRRLLAEDVHRQPFVFRTVFVDDLLRDTHHLQLRQAGPDLADDLFGGDLRDPQPFANAGDLVFRLDAAQLDHNVVGPHDLAVGIAFLQTGQLDGIADQVSADPDLQLLALDANRVEYVGILRGLHLGIRRVGGFPVLHQQKDVLNHTAVGRILFTLRPHHQSRLARRTNRHARRLEQRPEVRKISHVGVIGLVRVDHKHIQPPLSNNRRRPLNTLTIFRFRYHYTFGHTVILSFLWILSVTVFIRGKFHFLNQFPFALFVFHVRVSLILASATLVPPCRW